MRISLFLLHLIKYNNTICVYVRCQVNYLFCFCFVASTSSVFCHSHVIVSCQYHDVPTKLESFMHTNHLMETGWWKLLEYWLHIEMETRQLIFCFPPLVLTELVRMVMSGWGSDTHTLSFEFIPNCFLLYCLSRLTPPSMSSYLQQVCVCFFCDIHILFLKCLFCPMWRNPFISFSKYYPALQEMFGSNIPLNNFTCSICQSCCHQLFLDGYHNVKCYIWSYWIKSISEVSQFVSQIHHLLKSLKIE